MGRSGSWMALALLVLTGAGCGADLGLYGENVPLEAAVTRSPKPLVEQTTGMDREPTADVPPGGFEIAGTTWLPAGAEYSLGDDAVRPVAASGTMTVYALAWDEPPHEMLLVRTAEGRYRSLAPLY